MNRVAANFVRYSLFFLLSMAFAAGTTEADWTYEYVDDFSVDTAQYDAYLYSTFWTTDVNPLPSPYLFYLDASADRGLVFMDYKGELAELGYAFPVNTAQAQRIVEGVLAVDVSFPCNVEVSQFPPGQLFYSISADGAAWSAPQSLRAGHHEIPISSPEGTCYVRFSGGRVMINRLRASLSAPAATIRVPQNYSTLQQAIDAAHNGDVIEVAPGTYTGPGNWDIEFRGKRITVGSTSGPQNTIIDCGKPTTGSGHRGFYFHQGEREDSVLSGFTIRGGRVLGSTIPSSASYWNASSSHPIGGGIYCESSSPSIVNCIIEDCGAELGGGIGCVGGTPAIINCIVRDCLAGGLSLAESGGRGAGIAVVGRADAKITNCVIEGNSGYYGSQGAGVYCLQSTAVIVGCTISDNLAPGDLRGGGVYCGGDGTNVTLQNCIISNNMADIGAGALIERTTQGSPTVTAWQRCRVSIVNCTIVQNHLSDVFTNSLGGGVESSGADTTVTNSIIWYNNGLSLKITSPGTAYPVTYCDVQRGYSGPGNINEDPMFASTGTMLPDYHLRSVVGRYDPRSGRWVSDGNHSPCIDTGDPMASADDEPGPNGGRVNMGAYGATRWASKGNDQHVFHVDGQNGRDWNSGLSRTRAFGSLQRAIDTAHDGDAILVWPGVYHEEITFNRKAIIMQSAADAAVLTAPNGYAASFYGDESSRSILSNFVIVGCGEGGIYCDGASPLLKNLTLVDNQLGIASYGGGDPDIVNCIIWGSTAVGLFQCSARYSCLEQSSPGIGNISSDPLFADPANEDYHLRSRYGRYVAQSGMWVNDSVMSPCIDAGDPQDYPREERVPNGGRINMGAYGGIPFASMSSGPRCN